jgi:hypothetical protein
MKIKTLFLVFFICFSSYTVTAKYEKTKFDSYTRKAAEK